ncbi:MAG: thioesterase superfamily protein [Rhodospirillales bacterium]|nr:thioesterase superfamily protein [Rhodospirillales bacterium]
MAGPVETYRGVAYPWLCDAMGHMNTQFYSTLYDGAAFHFLALIAPTSELAPRRLGWADVRQTTEYKHEVRAGSLLVITTRLVKLGTSSITYLHEMRNVESGLLHSTSELVTVLFDLDARRAAPLDAAARGRAAALLE